MRVAHLLPTSSLGGAEKVVMDLARRQKAGGHEVYIVCSGKPLSDLYKSSGFNVHVINLLHFSLKSLSALNILVKDRKIEILHAHDMRASVYAYLISRIRKVATISHIHTCYQWMNGRNTSRFIDSLLRNKYNRTIACSKYVLGTYLEKNRKARKDKFVVLPNAMDFNEIRSSDTDNETSLLKKKGSFIFGYLGRLSPGKNIDFTIRAFHRFLKENPDVNASFVVLGAGKEYDRLKELIAELDCSGRVYLQGHVNNPLEHLAHFDVSVLFSSNEGLPMAVLEAMAMEKIVLTTRISGLKELIEDKKNGFFIGAELDETEAVALFAKVYRGFSELSAIRKQARETIYNHFNLDGYLKELDKLYDSCVDSST